MTAIEKLQSLYRQLDSQASAGDDVVSDLRKEINNLELAYLKDEVLPQVAASLGAKIKNLRCGLDCSIQFDEEGVINYSFCTTGSMLMIKDSIDAKLCIEAPHAPLHTIESKMEEPKPINARNTSNIRIVDYSEKAIAVYGDTRQLADTFRSIGGYFNARLKDGPGWVFSKKRRAEVEELIAPNSPTQSASGKSIVKSDNLFSSAGQKVPDAMTEDDWIKLLSNMKCMPYNGYIAPHKAIFLLTIIESIRCNYQKDNRIFPTKRLEETFRILWNRYVPKDWPFTINFFQPYAHMSNERFYDIVRVNDRAKFDINLSWTSVKASRYIKYGVLDNRLFRMLKNREFANRICDVLLQTYLNPSLHSNLNQSNNHAKTSVANGYLSDFRKYLLLRTNKHGKPFAASSINVYVGGLKNDYMQSLVTPYSSDGLLESIEDFKVLERIYNKVKTDAINGVVSNSVRVGLRLYIEYRTEKIEATSSTNSLLRDNNHVKPAAVVVPPKTEIKSTQIKSISAEHIHITEGNATSMIVQFCNEIGPELVADMNINYLGGMLVSKTPNPKYINASKKLNDGYWINTNSSTRTKIEQIKTICTTLGMEVNIEFGDNDIEVKEDDSGGKSRTLFSLNGHSPLNKRQSVLACVRLFMALNPNVPFEVVERNFPPELQGSYGVVAKLAKVNSRVARGYDDDKRYFLDKDKILKAKDGVEFVVCHQWGNQFPKFQEHIRKRFGWTLEEV
nr:MAG TPA: DNA TOPOISOMERASE I [Caudoviricetes sp.]